MGMRMGGDRMGRWMGLDQFLPIVLQSRHFPNLARGAGGVVWEVVDSVHGVPAVVGVGGLVDEEEFVDGLCDESGWWLVFCCCCRC
jgi:hypothetical protein